MRTIDADFAKEKMGNLDGYGVIGRCLDEIPTVQAVPIDVLDKIRAEIFNACSDSYHMPVYKLSCEEIFEIIDKYKAESEDKE